MTGFWLHFAARTLLRRRARSAITLVAIALGVGILTFLGSIMVGVEDAMIENSVSLHTGHVLVRSEDARGLIHRWRDRPGVPQRVVAVLPRLTMPALLVNESRDISVRVHLAGVLPARESTMSAIPACRSEGRYLAEDPRETEVFIGARTAEDLGASPGDTVFIRLMDGNQRRAKVCGLFRTGIERFDGGVAHAHLDHLAEIRTRKVRGEVAVFPDSDDVREIRGEVALFFRRNVGGARALRLIGPLLSAGEAAEPWEELIPELEQLTHLNRFSMLIVIALVVVMMAAGVSNTVLISVMDRYRDFGVLKALGATPREILWLILTETALMCLAAGSCGLLLGSATTLYFGGVGIDLAQFASDNPHFVISSVVRPRLTGTLAVTPALAVLGVSLLASLWPATIAARRRAAEVMRLST